MGTAREIPGCPAMSLRVAVQRGKSQGRAQRVKLGGSQAKTKAVRMQKTKLHEGPNGREGRREEARDQGGQVGIETQSKGGPKAGHESEPKVSDAKRAKGESLEHASKGIPGASQPPRRVRSRQMGTVTEAEDWLKRRFEGRK